MDLEKMYLLSTGRKGTKFLAHLLKGEHTFSVHEPKPTFKAQGLWVHSGRISKTQAHSILRKKRRRLWAKARGMGCSKYIESNHCLFSLASELPKVVHVVRDGRDVVRSGMNRPYGGYYTKRDGYLRIKPTKQDAYSEEWSEMSPFRKTCWLWQRKDSEIQRQLKNHGNSVVIKFRDIFYSRENKGIKQLAKFLSIPKEELTNKFMGIKSRKINKTEKYTFPHWKQWSQKQKNEFTEIAGHQMKKQGYRGFT